MAKSRKAGVVDSYAAIKAAQHAARTRPDAPSAESSVTEPGQPADLKKLGAAVARTAVPAKQIIECYECGYKFQLHGRAATTNCSKCRATLDLTDHVIDRKWNGSFKTVGTIRITADGVVQSGELIGGDVILEGTIEAGSIRAMHKLELRPGARFSEPNIAAPDLVIGAGATIVFIEPAEYRNVEILGTLRANLHATGLVAIRASGCFEGQLEATRLVVEEGGGLQAEARIGEVSLSP